MFVNQLVCQHRRKLVSYIYNVSPRRMIRSIYGEVAKIRSNIRGKTFILTVGIWSIILKTFLTGRRS